MILSNEWTKLFSSQTLRHFSLLIKIFHSGIFNHYSWSWTYESHQLCSLLFSTNVKNVECKNEKKTLFLENNQNFNATMKRRKHGFKLVHEIYKHTIHKHTSRSSSSSLNIVEYFFHCFQWSNHDFWLLLQLFLPFWR